MSEYWQCAFIGEGTSDNGLAEVLERLLTSMRPGDDVNLEPHEWTGRRPNNTEEKIKALAGEPYDLVFVHRDADSAGIDARIEECRSPDDRRVVPVIPVRMTEAWVLADLWACEAFRDWASRPRPGVRQGFRLNGIEHLADPKRILEEYLNRERSSFMSSTEFARERSQLVGRIRIDGDVTRLSAWTTLTAEISDALVRVRPHLGHE